MYNINEVMNLEQKKEKNIAINVTLNPRVLSLLDDMSEEWGLSRSGMIAALVKMQDQQSKSVALMPELQAFMKAAEDMDLSKT